MSLIVYFHHLPFLPCSSFLFAQDLKMQKEMREWIRILLFS